MAATNARSLPLCFSKYPLMPNEEAVAQYIAKHGEAAYQAAISQGLAPRHGRAYRELFQLVKAQLTAGDAPADDSDDEA